MGSFDVKGPETVAMEQKSSWQRDSHEFDLGKPDVGMVPQATGPEARQGSSLKEAEVVPGRGLMPASPRKEH